MLRVVINRKVWCNIFTSHRIKLVVCNIAGITIDGDIIHITTVLAYWDMLRNAMFL